MSPLVRLLREPALILGLVTAGLSLALVFGVDLSTEQVGAIGLFVSAAIALLRFLTTPSSEVVAQQKPGDPAPVAGPASEVVNGTPVVVIPNGDPPPA
jgi:hypothetical protein